jgi:DNA-binding transcriptional regulator YiaG
MLLNGQEFIPIVPIDDLHPTDVEAVRRRSSRAFKCGDCIETSHAKDGGGYAVFSIIGLRTQVARYITATKENLRYDDHSWQTRHTCDNPSCINPNHLVSGTAAQNAEDKVLRGRSTRGEKSASAKLTCFDVLAIRTFLNVSTSQFADWFGVSQRAVQQSRNGSTWPHLNDLVPPILRRRDGCRAAEIGKMAADGQENGQMGPEMEAG